MRKAITWSRSALRNSTKPSGWPSVSASVLGLRSGARVASDKSQPGLACEISMIADERCAVASSKVSCIHTMSAWLRALYSAGSGAVSQRLLHEPWILSVA